MTNNLHRPISPDGGRVGIEKNPDIMSTVVGGETVLMSVQTGKYYGLDEIGTAIWDRLQSPTSVAALCAALAETYDGTADEIARDVKAFVERLANDGLIEIRE